MKIMIDLNVLVDVLQRRTPFFLPSAKVCDAVRTGLCEGLVAAHVITTLFYIIRKGTDKTGAEKALDWLLSASAVARSCDYIVTRNLGDYRNSPVNAVAPEEFLQILK